ncbi:hypothetical protein WN48_04049 [Eufriesea mexicana]|uniref:Uncharacterized protein n=1 Tax=Eufriesea mexicana TaxID=516756 RepID=A0A310SEA1_9HYME|nr:hypothetical protein WN48_04049 [Eufriesea mexicana]
MLLKASLKYQESSLGIEVETQLLKDHFWVIKDHLKSQSLMDCMGTLAWTLTNVLEKQTWPPMNVLKNQTWPPPDVFENPIWPPPNVITNSSLKPGRSHAAQWGNSRRAAEEECSMPVAMVDHVCGDGYVCGYESSSGILAGCRADGDAALTDH